MNFQEFYIKSRTNENLSGVVHIYYDATGNRDGASVIINNSKTWRVKENYSLDCLLVHTSRLLDLSIVFNPLADAQIIVYADERAMQALQGRYPVDLLMPADEKSFNTKFLSNKLAVKTVDSIEEAVEHILCHSSRHSEVIISEKDENINYFINHVDSAAVYVNASTAPIKHDTQTIGFKEVNTYKLIVRGTKKK